MKTEFLQLFIDNPNITFEEWHEVTKRSKRSYYDYQKASKADTTTKVVPQSELEQVTKELDTLLTERDAWDKERADLLRAVEELPYENQQLEIENKELREKVASLEISANLLQAAQNENANIRDNYSVLQRTYNQLFDHTKEHQQELAQVQEDYENAKQSINIQGDEIVRQREIIAQVQKERDECKSNLQNAETELAKVQEETANLAKELAQVQAERDFLQLCEDEERERKQSFGRKSVWFLVILILITSFKNVWSGFDGVETDNLSSFMFSLIFAIAGFCIMQITNVARKLQLAISAICIAWECAFCASTLFSNMYKIAQVQETFAQVQKVQVAPIVAQISNYFDTDQQNTAFVVAWLLSISVSIILYTSIYLLTAKNK